MLLKIDRLKKSFPNRPLFKDLSAEIAPGNIVALLGANGAGKTTLLRCLATLAQPDQGEIRMDGELLTRGRIDLRCKLMFMEDFPAQLGSSPVEAVAVALRLWKAERPGVEDAAAALFERLGILDKAAGPGGGMSRGERYKAALATLLAVDPELWLMDEPFASGMDPQGIQVFRDEAAKAARRGRIIMYSTQLVELACGFSDIIGVLKDGCLTLYSTEQDLQRDPRRLEALMGAVP